MFTAVNDLSERLKLARERAGYAAAKDLAEAFGLKPSTYYGHENGDRTPGIETLKRYAGFLNVPYTWLLDGSGTQPATPSREPIVQVAPNAGSRRPASLDRNASLEVLGKARGGPDGHFEFNGEVLDRISRPPILAGVSNAYAVYVDGDSMEPRYFAGETVYVHPGRPITRNSFVVVQLHPDREGEPPYGFIKQFVAYTPSEIVLRQFNPAGEIRFDRRFVISVDRIVLAGNDDA